MKLQTIREYTLRARTDGVEKTTAAAEKLDKVTDDLAVSQTKVTKSALSVGGALDRLKRSVDADYRATQSLTKGQETLDRAMAQGRIGTLEYQQTLSLLTQKYTQAATAAAVATRANDNHTAGLVRVTAGVRGFVPLLSLGAGGFAGLAAAATTATGPIAGVGLAVAGTASAIAFAGDAYTKFENALKGVGIAQGTATQRMRELTAMSISNRTDLEGTVNLYARLTRSAEDLGASQGDIAKATDVLTKAIKVSGASTQEAAAGIQQLSQALQSGRLNGDELRSVMENMPTLVQAISKEFGVGVGELRKMGEEGKLVADRVFKAILNSAGDTNRAFAATRATMVEAASGALLAFRELGAELDRLIGLSSLLATAFQKVGQAAQGATGWIRATADANAVKNMQDTAKALTDVEAQIAKMQSASGDPMSRLRFTPEDLRAKQEQASRLRAEIGKLTEAAITAAATPPPAAGSFLSEGGLMGTEKQLRAVRGAQEAMNKAVTDSLPAHQKAAAQAREANATRLKEIDALRAQGIEEGTLVKLRQQSAEILGRDLADAAEKNAAARKSESEAMREQKSALAELTREAESAQARIDPTAAIRREAQALQEVYREFGHLLTDPTLREALEMKIKLGLDGKELGAVKQDINKLGDEIASVLGNAFSNAFNQAGAGFGDLVRSIGSGFYGMGMTGFQNSFLKPLMGGTAANDNKSLTSQLSAAIEAGAKDGTQAGWQTLLSQSKTAYAQTGAVGTGAAAIGGIVGAYSGGVQSQSPAMGALGGALSGAGMGAAMGFGPLGAAAGAIIGGIAGFIGGVSGASDAAAAKLRQATQQWRAQEAQINAWRQQMRGEGMGALGQFEAENRSTAQKAAQLARQAGRWDDAWRIMSDFNEGMRDQIERFRAGFDGMIESLSAGYGPNGPFVSARSAVIDLSDSLKGFVADAKRAGANVRVAKQASQDALLAVLNPPELSEIGSRMAQVEGAASGLKDALVDLGMSAKEAGDAVEENARKALDGLRTDFMDDLVSRLNDATGQGYMNDLVDARIRLNQDLNDAKALGVDPDLVMRTYNATVAEIIGGADLSTDALSNLAKQFPDLKKVIGGLGSTVTTETRRIRDAIRDFVQNLSLGPQSPLSPKEQFNVAQSEYNKTLTAAQGGDIAALEKITSVSQAYLEAAQKMFASGPDYVAIFNDVTSALSLLADPQRSGMQGVIDAINASNKLLALIDTNGNNQVSKQEAIRALTEITNTKSDAVKAAIDTNGDGIISKQEAVRALTAAGNTKRDEIKVSIDAVQARGAETRDKTEQVRAWTENNFNKGEAIRAWVSNVFDKGEAIRVWTENNHNKGEAIRAQAAANGTKTDEVRAWVHNVFDKGEAIRSWTENNHTKGEAIRAGVASVNASAADTATKVAALRGADNATLSNVNSAAWSTATSVDKVKVSTDSVGTNTGNTNLNAAAIATNTQGQLLRTDAIARGYYMLASTAQKLMTNYLYAIADNTFHAGKNEGAHLHPTQGKLGAFNYAFAQGGWVNGPGTGTSDSIAARLSNGEYVVRAAAAQANAPLLEAINARASPLPMPAARNDNRVDIRPVVDELRAMRQELAQARDENRALRAEVSGMRAESASTGRTLERVVSGMPAAGRAGGRR